MSVNVNLAMSSTIGDKDDVVLVLHFIRGGKAYTSTATVKHFKDSKES